MAESHTREHNRSNQEETEGKETTSEHSATPSHRHKNSTQQSPSAIVKSSSHSTYDSSTSNSSSSSSYQAHSDASPLSQHYDAQNDIILRIEYLSDSITKRFTLAIWAATAVGFALLLIALILVTTKPQSYWFQTQFVFIANTVIASAQIIILSVMMGYFLRRVLRAHITGKRWSSRRKRAVRVSSVELSLQLINSILFLAPNAFSLSRECTWFSPVIAWTSFGSWTIWNSFFLLFLIQGSSLMPLPQKLHKKASRSQTHQEVIYLDAPIWIHWPKALLWVAMEACLLALTIDLVTTPASGVDDAITTVVSCHDVQYSCDFTIAGHVLSNFVVAFAVFYLLWYVSFIYRAFQNFYSLPYAPFRMGNLILRLQLRQRALAFTFFIANIIVYFYVKRATCASYVIAWYGLTPMQIVMTAVALAQAYLACPKRPEKTAILQVWLQEFAWTEDDVSKKRSERVSSLPQESFEGFCMDCEPLFCFETAVKAMYWSFLAYDRGELPDSPFNSETALSLFNLKNFDIVWEHSTNAKAVIGWSDDPTASAVVIAFRGTAAASNVISDLQVWRTHYPAGVGSHLLGTAPMVHRGFLKVYTRAGFNQRLLSKVTHILNRCQQKGAANLDHPVKVILTGHSLGGALATLCSFDIANSTPCADYDLDICCYTFGSPRVGNHAWARLYNSKIPDTWQIINSDDVVTRAGKFWFLFKHVGHRVLLNRRGDLLVRPSFVEYSIRRSPGGSVKDHLLTSYQRAVVAVPAAQFGGGAKSIVKRERVNIAALVAEKPKISTDERVLRWWNVENIIKMEEGRGQVEHHHRPDELPSLPSGTPAAAGAHKEREKKKEEKEEREATEAAAAAVSVSPVTRLSIQLHQWWDKLEAKCFGRHALEPVAGLPPPQQQQHRRRTDENRPTADFPGKIDENDDEGGRVGGSSVVSSSPAVVEDDGGGGGLREGTAAELLQCQLMCRRMQLQPSPSSTGGATAGRSAVQEEQQHQQPFVGPL